MAERKLQSFTERIGLSIGQRQMEIEGMNCMLSSLLSAVLQGTARRRCRQYCVSVDSVSMRCNCTGAL